MKRNKHSKIKKEIQESSTSHSKEREEHDLAYYIHDRVELMHQVFSVLKYKELKSMAPACIRNISVDDLQELCTEELLGISSKRLCAILDGADPPSDTESSSQSANEQLETISLDSISSDEEILSQGDRSKKKKHKHRRRDSKSKHKKSKNADETEGDKSKASRAGLTVLELLELQARARAIRAQLQKEQIKPAKDTAAATQSTHSHSEDEVEIKEEPAEVVEISSDEEKPKIEKIDHGETQQKPTEPLSKTVTKRVNDLVITVPQQKTRKIKLNRTKPVAQETNTNIATHTDKEKDTTAIINKDTAKNKEKVKKKKKKRLSNASDNDEITLQLSDSEKMDLLEDLGNKNYDNVSSDTDSDSDSEDSDINEDTGEDLAKEHTNGDKSKDKDAAEDLPADKVDEKNISMVEDNSDAVKVTEAIVSEAVSDKVDELNSKSESNTELEIVEVNKCDENMAKSDVNAEKSDENSAKSHVNAAKSDAITEENTAKIDEIASKSEEKTIDDSKTDDLTSEENVPKETTEPKEKNLSDGELSDRESSEIEAIDLKPEVVCISDEEVNKSKKKKKKKDKKSKKDKKNKKKDKEQPTEAETKLTEVGNEGDKESKDDTREIDLTTTEKPDIHDDDDSHDVVEISDEIYELSDSSSYDDDIEISSVLSKEPTTLEIEALSAKIDEIDREEVITEQEIQEYENKQNETEISWKDRYLKSTKVKKVLNTSNILNALRKKNKQLKKRLEESRIAQETTEEEIKLNTEENTTPEVVLGSIEQYNTLEGSTKFVDPIKEVPINDNLKKDAKQLLKMYKKLLKYNDINRKKDPSKKKKKKSKKKEGEKVGDS